MTKAQVTVAILTKNEEQFVERAIRSAIWADEVLVVDSGSTDQTCELAIAAGARVVSQPWLGWLAQHKRAIDLAKHDWVMKLDADEIVSDELAESIVRALANNPSPEDGFVVHRVDEFLGELMPNVKRQARRDAFVRIFNRRHSNYNPALEIHEEVLVPGAKIHLRGPLYHWRNANIDRLISTYNKNATIEAAMILKQRPNGPPIIELILKPILRFGWSYLVCGGWKHGMRGYLRAQMQAVAELMRLAKAWEAGNVQPRPDPAPEQVPEIGRLTSE